MILVIFYSFYIRRWEHWLYQLWILCKRTESGILSARRIIHPLSDYSSCCSICMSIPCFHFCSGKNMIQHDIDKSHCSLIVLQYRVIVQRLILKWSPLVRVEVFQICPWARALVCPACPLAKVEGDPLARHFFSPVPWFHRYHQVSLNNIFRWKWWCY